MNKMVVYMLVALLLSGCATTQKYDRELKGWIGEKESALEASWGRPSAQKYLSPTSKVITYTKVSDWYIPSEYYLYSDGFGETDIVYDPFMSDYDLSPYATLVDTEVEEICQTSFWIQNGIITAWKWRGNNCVAE